MCRFLKNLIIASEYRKLHLLQTLFKSPNTYQKKELAQLLHCSIKTLESDIASLQELFDKDVAYVYEDRHKNILLDVGEHVNFAYLYAFVISNSHLYLLAKDIFVGKKINLAEWATENYTSLPTMYRRVRQIDAYLAESNLILETQPLAIKGSEINLRFFYYQIYSKSYPYTEWPFPDIPYETINQFILQVEAFYHIHFSLSSRIKYAISIAISLTRAQQGHHVTLDESLIHAWNQAVATQPDKMTIDYAILENITGNSLSDSERYFTLITAFWSHFMYKDAFFSDLRAKYIPDMHVPKSMLASELTNVLDAYSIPNKEVAMRETVDFLACFTFIDKMINLPEIPPAHVSPEEISLYKEIRTILTSYETHPDFRFIRQNKSEIVRHLTKIYSLLIDQSEQHPKIHVKVISENGYLWEEYVRREIKKKYSTDQVIFCSDTIPHESESHIDLIISDFPFYEQPGIQANGLLWNIPPSPTDYAQLDDILERSRA